VRGLGLTPNNQDNIELNLEVDSRRDRRGLNLGLENGPASRRSRPLWPKWRETARREAGTSAQRPLRAIPLLHDNAVTFRIAMREGAWQPAVGLLPRGREYQLLAAV
jgi:hypothetical protein